MEHQNSSSTLKEGIDIPYKASLQVHKFLNEQGIENEEIYKNLAILEWAYIRDIINKCSYTNIILAEDIIKKIFDLIGNSLNDNKKFTKFKKRIYGKSIRNLLIQRDLKSFIKKIYKVKIKNNW